MNHVTTTSMHSGVIAITLNRPEKRNALLPEMIAEMRELVAQLMDRADVSAVVLTGSPPAFCAGLDLPTLLDRRNDENRRRSTIEDLLGLYQTLLDAPKPVVAAVNGPAIAGGAGLVSVCDVAIAAESAVIGYPGIEHGLVPGVVMGFLTRRIGESKAAYLILTGEAVSGTTALSMGLVHECVADDRCLERAIELARRMAAFPANAYTRAKRTLRAIGAADLATTTDAVRQLLTELSLSDETARSLDSFLEDRK